MIRWRLMLTTLPFVAFVLALALVRDYVLQIKGVVEFSEVAPLLSAVSLIVGFMLAGVLADYKESEKLPGEIATTLETIGDTVEVVIALAKDVDAGEFRSKYQTIVSTVQDWLMGLSSVDKCYAALNDFRHVVMLMHNAAGVNYTIRCLGETNSLRKFITRVDVIKRTSFIPAGYALLDLLVTATMLLLLASNYKTPTAEYGLLTAFSLIFIYMTRLIADVDDPFTYASGKHKAGSAEVNPYPLTEYHQRLESGQK